MMYGWWDYGPPLPWMWFGPLMMLVFVVVAVLIAAWVLRLVGFGGHYAREKTALDLLKDRFARGEIDRREYEDRKQLL